MNVSTIVERTLPSRVQRCGRKPLALVATVGLAPLLAFVAVVTLQGGAA